MITAVIAAAMAALPQPSARAASPPPAADARPALWVVNDHDTIIYLFGTFHALDGSSDWFNDEVMTAFDASDELVLETLIPKIMPTGQPTPPQDGEPSSRLNRIGAVGPFAGSASFLSTTKTVMQAGRSSGMSTDLGADTVLRQAAEKVGKPVAGLESFEYQINMFSRLPAAPAPSSTREAEHRSAALAGMLTELQAAWNRGEAESFAPVLEQMRLRSPEIYRLLFLERNSRWAGWIAQRLQEPGTVFVAVGAGHLAGRDSVQRKLALAGIRTARIN